MVEDRGGGGTCSRMRGQKDDECCVKLDVSMVAVWERDEAVLGGPALAFYSVSSPTSVVACSVYLVGEQTVSELVIGSLLGRCCPSWPCRHLHGPSQANKCDSLDIFVVAQGFSRLRDPDSWSPSWKSSVTLYLCLGGWECRLGDFVGLSTACLDPSSVWFRVLCAGSLKRWLPPKAATAFVDQVGGRRTRNWGHAKRVTLEKPARAIGLHVWIRW